jgi:hypothetical protein
VSQSKRIILGVLVILVILAVFLGIDLLQGASGTESLDAADTIPAGSIPIYLDGELLAAFTPQDLEKLSQVNFVDAEEGKTQQGWMLAEVLDLHVSQNQLQPNTVIIVSSSSREKSAQLTWAEVEEPTNMVMFDLSGRGTLKLVSKLEELDIRDEWIQDVDKIELLSP